MHPNIMRSCVCVCPSISLNYCMKSNYDAVLRAIAPVFPRSTGRHEIRELRGGGVGCTPRGEPLIPRGVYSGMSFCAQEVRSTLQKQDEKSSFGRCKFVADSFLVCVSTHLLSPSVRPRPARVNNRKTFRFPPRRPWPRPWLPRLTARRRHLCPPVRAPNRPQRR